MWKIRRLVLIANESWDPRPYSAYKDCKTKLDEHHFIKLLIQCCILHRTMAKLCIYTSWQNIFKEHKIYNLFFFRSSSLLQTFVLTPLRPPNVIIRPTQPLAATIEKRSRKNIEYSILFSFFFLHNTSLTNFRDGLADADHASQNAPKPVVLSFDWHSSYGQTFL